MEQPAKTRIRVSAFVDGFNLYHALDDLKQNHLKWLNLRTLLENFAPPQTHDLREVYYFSAHADWMPDKRRRHKAYVYALRHAKVTPVMGNFKPRDMECLACGNTWVGHEEKQSDVNLAVQLVRDAYKDTYDQALIVSGDSDLAPPIRLLREIFPEKKVKIVSPPGRYHSKELCQISHGRAKIDVCHLEASLFPDRIATLGGLVTRPIEYDPP